MPTGRYYQVPGIGEENRQENKREQNKKRKTRKIRKNKSKKQHKTKTRTRVPRTSAWCTKRKQKKGQDKRHRCFAEYEEKRTGYSYLVWKDTVIGNNDTEHLLIAIGRETPLQQYRHSPSPLLC